jgi:agmatine deiminase
MYNLVFLRINDIYFFKNNTKELLLYIYQYDAFSDKPNKGNPAGVGFDADNLSEKQMQEIAKVVGFNETAKEYKLTRRNFIFTSAVLSGGFIMGYASNNSINDLYRINASFMQDESKKHKRTWMTFVANDYIWTKKQMPEVKKDLALLASTIAKYEPVSILVDSYDKEEVIQLLNGLDSHNFPIELIEFSTDDLWFRDTAPTFVKDKDGNKAGINFNFNGWGEKQEHIQDSKVADFITLNAGANIINSNLVLEGGSFEIDGVGTAILTQSSVLNDNRNPGVSKKEFEDELKLLLGLKKIIWLKGIKGKDITDAHIDFYARFSKVGRVLVSRENYKDTYDYEITRQNIKILQNSTDANGNKLEVVVIDNPEVFNESFGINDFAAGYIGYYACNNAIIMQKFGDKKADENAYNIIKKEFPNRTIEQISIDGIASGGGTIHCSTQQEPEI